MIITLSTLIGDLPLQPAIRKALLRGGITTFSDLLKISEGDLAGKFTGIGAGTAYTIATVVEAWGYKLGGEISIEGLYADYKKAEAILNNRLSAEGMTISDYETELYKGHANFQATG